MGKGIEEIVAALKGYDPKRVILFGSWARGEEDRYSDIDLVIIKETEERFLDRINSIYEILQPLCAIDVLVYTPDEFERMRQEGNPFIEKVLQEGMVIYERPSKGRETLADAGGA
ncbi:MAG: nucleotidyltransferase domain-containing protein [Dehalococcoidia bacterium]|nr:nucleotidyltransferase domain-containing protein [Dehalococcoidia bacterium]